MNVKKVLVNVIVTIASAFVLLLAVCVVHDMASGSLHMSRDDIEAGLKRDNFFSQSDREQVLNQLIPLPKGDKSWCRVVRVEYLWRL